ncbi:hypothetical protein LTR95_008088 [Oleoguttula sp. CCFEE 5521]
MDLPLSLDPMNQTKGKPPVTYDPSKPSRFGVFPRRNPEQVRWFETDASCIFHTANTWDDTDSTGQTTAVNMLACRLTSATLVFAAGNIKAPIDTRPKVVMTAKRMPFFSKYDYDTEESVFEKASLLESPSEEREALLRIDNNDEEAFSEADGLHED